MIRIFYGVPGAGKSFGALKDLVDELLYGTRLIVTNLPIDLGRLNAWLQHNHPKIDFGDITQRIRLIREEDTKTFYCFRDVAADPLKCPTKEESMRGTHVNYENAQPVCYYIDEAHIAFDARNWDKTGPELTFYASQHRKKSDECVFITQHPDMLERRLRMLAQQFYGFTNHSLERVWTFFQKPAFFSCLVYRLPPNGGPNREEPEERRYYRLDKALADCYDTSAGIGISGRKMPEVKRKSGAPVWLLLIPLALACYLLMKAPQWTGKAVTAAMGGLKEGAADIGGHGLVTGAPLAQKGGAPVTVAKPHTITVVPGPVAAVFVQSYILSGDDVLVTLTDGRMLDKASGVYSVTKEAVMMRDGTSYPIQRGRVTPREKERVLVPVYVDRPSAVPAQPAGR